MADRSLGKTARWQIRLNHAQNQMKRFERIGMTSLGWLCAAVAAALLSATPAAAFVARNDLVVVPESRDTFNIPFRGLTGAPDFWCAAGDYAQRRLGASPVTRIYRLSEPPRRSGQGIRSSLNPEGAASDTGLVHFGGQASSISAGLANDLCNRQWLLRE